MSVSPYYKNTGRISVASKISTHFRRKMFFKFMDVMQPQPEYRILDIGVTNDNTYQESNYFEKMYPYPEQIVCIGTEDGGHLEKTYPGLKFHKINRGDRLPFQDKEFDIAFSNAVIEHVGDTQGQKAFVKEMLRVSKSFFLTTPNRWFPIEFHTALPLLHFLPKKIYREILTAVGESFWSKEENLNLLNKTDLRALFPYEMDVRIDSVGIFGMPTNLIAYLRIDNSGGSI